MEIFKRTLLVLILLPSPIAWAQSPHSYFDWLSQQPEKIVSNAYRTQAEIDRDSPPKRRPNPNVHYDSGHDAARVTVEANMSGIPTFAIVRPSFDNTGYGRARTLLDISTGNLLFTWDAKWDQGFLDVPAQGLRNHKAFQLSYDGAGDARRIEVRTRYSLSDSSYVAKTDNRIYQFGHSGGEQPMGSGGCPQNWDGNCQINGFDVQEETWTRYWCYVDFDNGTYSFWMADENNSPVKLFDNYKMGFTSGLNNFWFEYNSSQTRTGPEVYGWFRNFTILHNVSDVDVIVAQGANLGASISTRVSEEAPSPPSPDSTPPSPPNNLEVQ